MDESLRIIRDTFREDLVMSHHGDVAQPYRFHEPVTAEALVNEESRLRL